MNVGSAQPSTEDSPYSAKDYAIAMTAQSISINGAKLYDF